MPPKTQGVNGSLSRAARGSGGAAGMIALSSGRRRGARLAGGPARAGRQNVHTLEGAAATANRRDHSSSATPLIATITSIAQRTSPGPTRSCSFAPSTPPTIMPTARMAPSRQATSPEAANIASATRV